MAGPATETARRIFGDEGIEPSAWSNAPGDTYGWHSHPYHKVLVCVEGEITFHTSDGDHHLVAGDRLDLPPHTSHAATVGPSGVTCWEGHR